MPGLLHAQAEAVAKSLTGMLGLLFDGGRESLQSLLENLQAAGSPGKAALARIARELLTEFAAFTEQVSTVGALICGGRVRRWLLEHRIGGCFQGPAQDVPCCVGSGLRECMFPVSRRDGL
jgi:hypothetical protein